MGELAKKRVHWKEYNGDTLIHDEDVDVLTSADCVTFDDGETMQYKYTQGQFVSPSDMGYKTNLRTDNKSTLVDAINEVKTSATSNESSIISLANRVSTNENDIGALETRVTPLTLGGTGATSASGALSNFGITATASELNKLDGMTATTSELNTLDGITATTTELNYVDGVTSNIQTQLNGKASTKTYTATLTTSWSGDSAPYTQTVTVSGITSSDTPIVDVVLSSTTSTALSQLEAWGCVSQITTGTDSITATCLEDKPTTAIPIQLKVVR